jgi:hypothetical protein
MKMTVLWDVATCRLIDIDRRFREITGSNIWMMMEAIISSETSVSIYQTTWCNTPEDSHLHPLNVGGDKIWWEAGRTSLL